MWPERPSDGLLQGPRSSGENQHEDLLAANQGWRGRHLNSRRLLPELIFGIATLPLVTLYF